MDDLTANILRVVFWFSLTAMIYTYFLYPLLLLGLSRLVSWHDKNYLPNRDMEDEDYPTVTMVISAYNERNVLPAKIENCKAIHYPAGKIRFLIGSDGSGDSTSHILRRIDDSHFQTVISRIRRGKVRMLNRLMELVDSEIVVFSDANTMYAPDAIQYLVRTFQNEQVGAVIGKLELSAPGNDPHACHTESLYWRYENRIKRMESILGAVPSINGGVFAVRRELYHPLPDHAVTEDQVLGMSIMARGYRCLFNERARAYETVSSWSGELHRRIRISAGNFQSLFLVPALLNPRRGWIWFSFVSHKLLRWLVPFFLLGMLTANLFLAGRLFYGSTLLLQALFYAGALAGTILPKLSGALKILAIPRYFLAMNLAILIGLTRFISRRQHVTWRRTQR